jgi:hypothetical protein
VGLEYAAAKWADEELDPDRFEECLGAAADVLTRRRLTVRFGIGRQRNPPGITDGEEVLLEETSMDPRELIARPVGCDDSRFSKATETFWTVISRGRSVKETSSANI